MRTASILYVVPALVPVAAAQSPVVLVRDADVIAGVGNVTSIENLAVNSPGSWIVEADTDNANTAVDGVMIKDGVVVLRQGDALAAPAGATVGSFDACTLNSFGESGWNLFLTGPPISADSGLFLGSTLVLQEGAVSTATAFTPGTPYVGFLETKFNDARTMLVVASVDDPAVASTVDRAMVLVQTNSMGALLAETVLLKEGDLVPGIAVETITDFGTGPHDFALNNSGVALYTADLTGTVTTDGVLLRGTTVIAREGDASPVAGRVYETLYDRHLDLSDSGDYVFIANLDGATTDDDVILKNGTTVVAREGSGLPAIGAFTLTSFGTGPVRIDASGDVFWFGDWNDPDLTRDTGIFKNGELIVQEGVTMTSSGEFVSFVGNVESSFTISPDGRWLLFEGRVGAAMNDAAFLFDLNSSVTPFCFGDGTGAACPCGNSGAAGNGCANSVVAAGARITATGASSISADTLVLTGSGMPNSSALYFQGTAQQGGGLGVPFGDGLRCAGGTIVRLGTKSNIGGTSQFPEPGDPSVSVRGLVTVPGTRTYQCWYRNAAAFCTVSTFNLTNGVEVAWGS